MTATISGVFISADSTELETARRSLADTVEGYPDWKVYEQGNNTFIELNDETLRKCDELIRQSMVVVQLVGRRSGNRISQESLTWLRSRYGPALSRSWPFLEVFLKDASHTLSYTQWEAWLALLHDKNLLLYEVPLEAASDAHHPPGAGNSAVPCARHLEMLRQAKVYVDGTGLDVTHALQLALYRFSKRVYELPAPIDFAGYALRKRMDFVGRRWLLERLDRWADSSADRSLLLVGGFGYGKSAFVAQLLEDWSQRRVVVFHYCRYDDDSTLKPGCIVRNIAAQLVRIFEDYGQLVENNFSIQEYLRDAEVKPIEAMRFAVLNPLRELETPGSPCFLVIDALDESLDITLSPGPNEHTLLDLIESAAGELPPWFHVFITSRPVDATRSDTVKNRFELIDLEAEDRDEQADDIHEYVSRRSTAPAIARFLADARLTPESLCDQLQRSGSTRFLLVRSILDDIVAGHIVAHDANRLPLGMGAFYEQAFNRRVIRSNLDKAVLLDVLGVIVVAREPIPAASIAAIVGIELHRVQQIFGAFGGLLVHDARGGITLGHMSLEDWLRKGLEVAAASEFGIRADVAQAKLGAYCKRRTIEGLQRAGEFRRYLRGFGIRLLLGLDELDAAIRLLLQLRRETKEGIEADCLKTSQLQLQTHTVLAALKSLWKKIDDPAQPGERDDHLRVLAAIGPPQLHGLLAEKDYETGLYVPAIRTLITCHAVHWPTIKQKLFEVEDENDIVFRNDVGVAYSLAWYATGPEQRARLMAEIEDMAAASDDNEREIAGYAIKGICERYETRTWRGGYREKIQALALRYARAPDAVDRMVGGEILLALAIHGERVDLLFADDLDDDCRFWDPYWPNQRSDVDAINTLLGDRTTLNATKNSDAVRSFEDAQSQHRHAEALRRKLADAPFFTTSPIGPDLRASLESFEAQYHDEFLFGDAAMGSLEKGLKGTDRETILDVFRLMLLHPLWNVIERATSLIAEVIRRDEELMAPILDELAKATVDLSRIRYGVIDAAYNSGCIDDHEKFFSVVYRFGRDPDCRVRGICADDVDGWIRHAHPSMVRARVESSDFMDLMRFWVEHADDQWLLEYLHEIFYDLAHMRKIPHATLARLIDKRSRFLPPGRFYEMDLNDYLEHIEAVRSTEWQKLRETAVPT